MSEFGKEDQMSPNNNESYLFTKMLREKLNTPCMFKNQSPLLENLLWSASLYKQSPLIPQMLSQLNLLAGNLNAEESINLNGSEHNNDENMKKGDPDNKKELKMGNNKMLSPSIESPNQMLLCSSYIMANQNLLGASAFNDEFLGAPKYRINSPFRTSLF